MAKKKNPGSFVLDAARDFPSKKNNPLESVPQVEINSNQPDDTTQVAESEAHAHTPTVEQEEIIVMPMPDIEPPQPVVESFSIIDDESVLSEECAYKIVNYIADNDELLNTLAQFLAKTLNQQYTEAEKIGFINNSVHKNEINSKLIGLKQELETYINQIISTLQILPTQIAMEQLKTLTN